MDLSLSSEHRQIILHALGCNQTPLIEQRVKLMGYREQSQFYRNRYYSSDPTCWELVSKGLMQAEEQFNCSYFTVTEKGIESVFSKKEMEYRRRIRIGDDVIVRTPVFVKRVGYPLCKDDIIRNKMTIHDKSKIDEFVQYFGVSLGAKSEIVYDRIVDAIALGMLHNREYGGNKRSLHTIEKLEYTDYVGRVVDRKVVKTGTRISGHGYAEDYEQPHLDDEKTHLLFMVELLRPIDESTERIISATDCFWIEAGNLEKPLVSL